ncbi:MAG: Sua5/YciO/YrdC/YwlC family protein [Xanthomonadales bacterium]|nr:Sua5/YciO/YrdC/YwlC family protein [Xanthomonadales bacterium]
MSGSLPELSTEGAVDALIAGEVIAWPTEAVWGLGCDPYNPKAVAKLLSIKQRPVEMGLILIAADFEQLQNLLSPVTVCEMRRALGSWPGPVSWLFPVKSDTPDWLRGKHQTLAVRVTDHPLSRRLCRAFGGPLVSTSANPTASAAATSLDELKKYFSGSELAGYLDGDLGEQSNVSEIRDLISNTLIRG